MWNKNLSLSFCSLLIFSFLVLASSLPNFRADQNLDSLQNSNTVTGNQQDDTNAWQENFKKASEKIHQWFEGFKSYFKPAQEGPISNTTQILDIDPSAPKIVENEEILRKNQGNVNAGLDKLEILQQKLAEMHEKFEERLKKLEKMQENEDDLDEDSYGEYEVGYRACH